MADVYIYSSQPVSAVGAAAGDALVAAEKELYPHPETQERFRLVAPRTWGLLALSISNTNTIGPGRIAELTISLGTLEPGSRAAFRIEQRRQTFAPAAADRALQAGRYDYPVVVEK
jgi:hypothetical protein